jgi:hypothetical protein
MSRGKEPLVCEGISCDSKEGTLTNPFDEVLGR